MTNMTTTRKTLGRALLAATLAGMTGLPALAGTELRLASGFGPNHPSAPGYEVLISELSRLSDGRYSGQNFASGLVAPNEMLSALETGIVDVGSVLMAYYPAEFVESSLPGEMGLLNTSLMSSSGATTEYIVGCPECLAEFTAQGEVFTGATTTSAYQILTKAPIASLADLKGMPLRTGSAAYSRWAQAIGATAVQMPAPEVFEALNQGVVEGHINSAGDLMAYQLYDIILQVTQIDFGTFNGCSGASLRKAVWDGLSAEDRKIFIQAFNRGMTEILIQYQAKVDASIDEGKKQGIAFVDAPADIKAANAAFLEKDLAEMEERLTKKGIKNAAEKIARFKALTEKWEKLTDGLTDMAQYEALVNQEVWSKIDLATYPN